MQQGHTISKSRNARLVDHEDNQRHIKVVAGLLVAKAQRRQERPEYVARRGSDIDKENRAKRQKARLVERMIKKTRHDSLQDSMPGEHHKGTENAAVDVLGAALDVFDGSLDFVKNYNTEEFEDGYFKEHFKHQSAFEMNNALGSHSN